MSYCVDLNKYSPSVEGGVAMSRNLMGLLALTLAAPMASAQMPTAESLGPVSAQGLSAQQAEQVLRLVLKHEGHNLNSPDIHLNEIGYYGEDKLRHPGYWDFVFMYAGLDIGGASWKYTVSKSTGDVWEFHRCKRYAFPALQALQKSIMRQTGKTMADEQAQRRGLHCMDDASVSAPHLGHISPKGLSSRQAREILMFALSYKEGRTPIYWINQALKYYKGGWVHFKRPGVFYFIEEFRSSYSGYREFGSSTANAESGDIHGAGRYVVSNLTGDVFDLDSCERYVFPALQRIQKNIMKITGKTMADEKSLRNQFLSCPDELLY